MKIIAFDGQPEAKQAIRDGKIYADPVQHPDEIGRKTVQVIAAYFQGETPPKEILIEPNLYRRADAERELKVIRLSFRVPETNAKRQADKQRCHDSAVGGPGGAVPAGLGRRMRDALGRVRPRRDRAAT